ncbi:MAG: winged helix-turn-helix domain-containing protein [Candidatus Bathyarchaeia archaeon]
MKFIFVELVVSMGDGGRVWARHRRSRVEVIVEILREALDGANKTRLMYRCNLNFRHFNRYLGELLDAGLLERVPSNPESGLVLYKTTEKGRELLKILEKAGEFLSV